MKLAGRELLEEFFLRHAEARGWVTAWLAEVEGAKWMTSHDVKARYASASFLADNRVIFNVRGDKYRLEVAIAYKTSVVHVIWTGTHAEYSKR